MSGRDSTAAASPKIATVIVNYGAADMVIDHFPALKAECEAFPGSRVYIVDNASPGDDGAKLAGFAAGEPLVFFIQGKENGGFAQGNNIALRQILAAPEPFDYIFLLNPDAFPRPGALRALTDFLASRPDAWLAGARLETVDGAPHVSAFRYFSIFSEFDWGANTGFVSTLLSAWRVAPPQKDETSEADWLCAAALLIRPEVFKDAGLFDERYFLYYEETDLMLGARRAGWPSWYVPAARAVHYEGSSTGVKNTAEIKPQPNYWYRSRAYYYRKNHGALYAAVADLAWMSGALFYLARVC
ncbi:MAG: glycosyltransferase family 2 protein, partial [Amphiplicatus sp.]